MEKFIEPFFPIILGILFASLILWVISRISKRNEDRTFARTMAWILVLIASLLATSWFVFFNVIKLETSAANGQEVSLASQIFRYTSLGIVCLYLMRAVSVSIGKLIGSDPENSVAMVCKGNKGQQDAG